MNSAPARYRITRGRLGGLILLWVVIGTAVGLALALRGPDEAETARDGETVTIRVGGRRVLAEVAATDESRTRGVAGRPRLALGRGMLFLYDSAAARDFWMRGVRFPLDMIWIRDGRVTGVTRNARPASETDTRLYPSAGAIDRVLEVPGGWSAAEAVAAGDRYSGP